MGCQEKYMDFFSSKTCKKCKGLIRDTSFPGYCDQCAPVVEEAFHRIKNYLHACPGATPFEIQSALGLSIKTINLLISDGMISLDIR